MEKIEELVEILLEIRELVDDALDAAVPPPPNTLAKAPQEGRSEEEVLSTPATARKRREDYRVGQGTAISKSRSKRR